MGRTVKASSRWFGVALAVSTLAGGCALEATPGGPARDGAGGGAGAGGGVSGGGGSGPTTNHRPCSGDNDCLMDFPLCVKGLCNTCSLVDSSGCGGDKPICAVVADGAVPVCAECERSSDCADGSCVRGACVTSCSRDADCPTAQPFCGAGGQCVECTPTNACAASTDLCSPTGECVQCTTDADCGSDAPTCSEGSCVCALDVNQLGTDRNNCGGCGQACLGNDVCASGSCTEPSNSRFTTLSGGNIMKSSAYTLYLSSGQAPGGNAVLSSSRFTLKSGFPGTTSP